MFTIIQYYNFIYVIVISKNIISPLLIVLNIICYLVNKFQGNITDGRNSIKCIQKQTKRMVTRSLKKNQELEVGTNVHVCIPNVDITRGSPSNLLAVITHIDNGFYELCKINKYKIKMYIIDASIYI